MAMLRHAYDDARRECEVSDGCPAAALSRCAVAVVVARTGETVTRLSIGASRWRLALASCALLVASASGAAAVDSAVGPSIAIEARERPLADVVADIARRNGIGIVGALPGGCCISGRFEGSIDKVLNKLLRSGSYVLVSEAGRPKRLVILQGGGAPIAGVAPLSQPVSTDAVAPPSISPAANAPDAPAPSAPVADAPDGAAVSLSQLPMREPADSAAAGRLVIPRIRYD